MKKKIKIGALFMAALLSVSSLAACSPSGTSQSTTQTNTTSNQSNDTSTEPAAGSSGPDISKEVNLVYYLWGGPGPASQDLIDAINAELKPAINATLEVKYIDWGDVATKYPLLFASGETFDMSHASPNAVAPLFTLAAQDALVDITDMLDTYAPILKEEIPSSSWDSAKYDGKIIAVPCLYSEYTPIAFVYRRDFKEKYGVPEVTDFASLETYLDKALEVESFPPLNGNANMAIDMYKVLVESTGEWIFAPGIKNSENFLVASSYNNYKDIIHPAFTPEFEEWAVKMKEWADKGYWARDILSAQVGAKDNLMSGNSSAFLTHMSDWTGAYGGLKEKLPDSEMDAWHFSETANKIIKKSGIENSTVISKTSKNPERALMAIELFMTNEKLYRLMQNGIEGRQYVIEDNMVVQPDTFDPEKDGGGFAAWSLRNDKLNLPLKTEDPRRYELIEQWNAVSVSNPYTGFTFNEKNVTAEISSVSNVNSQLGMQLMLGKTPNDPREAVAEYRAQLENAGINKIIEEVKAQLETFVLIED